jgi:steroid 5-alpha reductase family enzyme
VTVVRLLLADAAVVAACFLALWLIALRLRDVSFVDAWWALGMVVLAWASFAVAGDAGPRGWLLAVLCTVWGARLGVYLLWRWRRNGPDRRYQTMAGKAEAERGIGFARWSLTQVFALQAPLQFIVALPVELGALGGGRIGWPGWLGAALAIIGIGFETIGDAQLARFEADPANAGKVMDRGLWRYTRHPNYFGDACVWWGLWLIAAQAPFGPIAVAGPILLTFLLTRWSGVPTTEGRMRRKKPGYEDYVRRTPGFVPWFPRSAPPG